MKRAQTHLLEHLYSHVTNLGTAEGGDNLLDEDPDVMQRRAAGQKSLQVSLCLNSMQAGVPGGSCGHACSCWFGGRTSRQIVWTSTCTSWRTQVMQDMKGDTAALTRLPESSCVDKLPVSTAILEQAGCQQLAHDTRLASSLTAHCAHRR